MAEKLLCKTAKKQTKWQKLPKIPDFVTNGKTKLVKWGWYVPMKGMSRHCARPSTSKDGYQGLSNSGFPFFGQNWADLTQKIYCLKQPQSSQNCSKQPKIPDFTQMTKKLLYKTAKKQPKWQKIKDIKLHLVLGRYFGMIWQYLLWQVS